MTISILMAQVVSTARKRPEIEAGVYAAVAAEPREARFPLSPSQCLKSKRDLYYALTNYHKPGTIPENPIEPRILMTFRHGYAVEELLKTYVGKAFKVVFPQERVTIEGGAIEIGGAIDWAIEIDGKTILVDSKSSGNYAFKHTPKEDNIAQMQLYMHSTWGRANNVNSAILIYFNKDNSEIKCIEVDYNADLAQALVTRLFDVLTTYHSKQLPAREYVLGLDWQANYSNYRDYDNAEFDAPVSARQRIKIKNQADFRSQLRDHVILYGNAILDYGSEQWYVVRDGVKLKLQKIGEKQWTTIG